MRSTTRRGQPGAEVATAMHTREPIRIASWLRFFTRRASSAPGTMSAGHDRRHPPSLDRPCEGVLNIWMHDDLIDALDWTITRGYTDPQRVGIHGGSYGGYVALVGAAFTPGAFRCPAAERFLAAPWAAASNPKRRTATILGEEGRMSNRRRSSSTGNRPTRSGPVN